MSFSIHPNGTHYLQESGQVDQSAGMLDDDVKEKGYALLCVSTPQSDCKIRTIEEVRCWQLSPDMSGFWAAFRQRVCADVSSCAECCNQSSLRALLSASSDCAQPRAGCCHPVHRNRRSQCRRAAAIVPNPSRSTPQGDLGLTADLLPCCRTSF